MKTETRKIMRTEFPNLAIVAVTLKAFCRHYIDLEDLEQNYPTPEDKLEAVKITASDLGDEGEEVVLMCEYIERQKLTRSFFPE